jgi:hypothetical protein
LAPIAPHRVSCSVGREIDSRRVLAARAPRTRRAPSRLAGGRVGPLDLRQV